MSVIKVFTPTGDLIDLKQAEKMYPNMNFDSIESINVDNTDFKFIIYDRISGTTNDKLSKQKEKDDAYREYREEKNKAYSDYQKRLRKINQKIEQEKFGMIYGKIMNGSLKN